MTAKSNKNTMNSKNIKILKIIILSLAGLTLLVGVGYVLFTWNQPLSAPLNLPTKTQEPTLETETPQATVKATEVPTITPSLTIEPVCGGPLSLNILVSGVASNNYLYGLADAVRIVRVDFQNPGVTVIALPRDLWVDIPGLENHDITAGKLNQAYFYGTEGMGYFAGSGYGSGLLAETLLYNYGFRSDNYLAVNLKSFRNIVDSMGGIDVYLTGDVYKRVYGQPELFLRAGTHHLDGKQAENLARQRITIGDFGRINNQTVVLRGVAAKMLSPSGISSLPSLVNQLIANVKTDLSPEQITQLICLAGKIDYQEDTEFLTLPTELMVEQRVYDAHLDINTAALVGDTEQIRSLLIEFQNGTWP